jgi:hypothetical protein
MLAGEARAQDSRSEEHFDKDNFERNQDLIGSELHTER